MTNIWKVLCFLLVTGGLGCGMDRPDTNLAPRIIAFEAESNIVDPGTEVQIRLVTSDFENDLLSYTWTATAGDLTQNASGALWRAPEAERKYQIKVTVSDGAKAITSTLDIQVWRSRPGNYYPLAVGNTWHYRSEGGSETITFEIVDTIQIQRVGGAHVESFVLQKSTTVDELENIVNYAYLGPRVNEKGEISGIVQHAANITSGTEDTILFEPFLPLYQFPFILGEKWKVNFLAKLVPELLPFGAGVDEFEVLSEETVTVPAGTFEHVFQVQEAFRWAFDIGGQDFSLDVTVAQKWIAPDVGIIKFTQSQTRGDVTVDTIFELESFELVEN